MRFISANLIYTLDGDPIKNGVLCFSDDGRLKDICSVSDCPAPFNTQIEYFDGCIVPGFVNSHAHLELAWMKNLVRSGTGLSGFINDIFELRSNRPSVEIREAKAFQALCDLKSSGVVAVADICNTTDSLMAKANLDVISHSFIEVFGTDPSKAESLFENGLELLRQFKDSAGLRASLSSHAPYSSSADLFEKVSSFIESKGQLHSLHFKESEFEDRYFGGALNETDQDLRKLVEFPAGSIVRGKTVSETITDILPSKNRLLFVHNVHLNSNDIVRISNHFMDFWFCLCPVSNMFISGQTPPLSLLRSKNCRIVIGTDSHASNPQLFMLDEIKLLHKHFPDISLNELFAYACINGARLLGIEDDFGSFSINKKPGAVLITHFDPENLSLSDKSEARRII